MNRAHDPTPPSGLEPAFDAHALRVLEARYLRKDERGEVVETPAALLWRVARAVAAAEAAHGGDPEALARAFYEALARLEFLPNSPTLMNAGRPRGQLSACFVLPVEDELEAIFDTVKHAARIHQTGGGTGFAFSRLRPRHARLSSGGEASGPVSFMKVFDAATAAVYQGGVRRGANMGILRVDHPDVLEFIDAKREPGVLTHFNISVAITDAFMQALEQGGRYDLLDAATRQPVGSQDARTVWERIVRSAWATGDPGLVFIDRINAAHPTPNLGEIESTNPCVPGDTWVLTEDGPRQVDDLVGKPVRLVVDGEVHPSEEGFFTTGVKPVLEVVTAEGHRVRATREHRLLRARELTRYRRETEWVEVGDVVPGDRLVLGDHRSLSGWPGEGTEQEGLLIGALLGDGTLQPDGAIIDVWGAGPGPDSLRRGLTAAAMQLRHRSDFRGFRAMQASGATRLKSAPLRDLAAHYGMAPGRKAPSGAIEQTSSAFHAGFLRGLFDTDGCVQGTQAKGVSIRLAQSDLDVLRLAQRMLMRLGIASRIYANRRLAGTRMLPDGRGGLAEYEVRAQHELVVAGENLPRFDVVVGFTDASKAERLRSALAGYRRTLNRERFVARVVEVREVTSVPVYDVRVRGANRFDANGFVAHNCGELPLLPYESCNLGSVDLHKHLLPDASGLDWERLRRTVHLGVRFLDDVIDSNVYPLPQIAEVTRTNRKIGLGVMGLADALIALGIPYASERAVALAHEVMAFVLAEARAASRALARERGPFLAWAGSRPEQAGEAPLRNATVTTIAPTGTIALLAGCSSGIEPLYAVAYVRRALDGKARLEIFHPQLERVARARGFWSEDLRAHVLATGTLEGAPGVPEDVRALFATAHEIAPEWHVRMQAAFQAHVENSVSKTINLPRDSRPDDVAGAYLLAYRLGCKGITVYRDGSREGQVLATQPDGKPVAASPEHEPSPLPPANCPECAPTDVP
ncbi:MAG: ribonucleoside reductase class II [Planctomycetota bacterium]|nr:ribonucleoside reductase class II [Planctomycetota bacterium]